MSGHGPGVALSAEDRNRFAQRLFTPLPGRYDRLAEILSMGQNGRWRRAMVDRIAASLAGPGAPSARAGGGPLVLDVASGTAGVAVQLASRTGARVVGVDLTEDMLRQGQANVSGAGLSSRIGLIAGQAERLPFPDGSFDALTFTYLLRYVEDPQATLDRAGPGGQAGRDHGEPGVLRPPGALLAGRVGAVHAAHPAGWRRCCSAAGLVRVGQFLGPNITGHYRRYPVRWTAEAWQRAGFVNVRTQIMSLGGGLVMWGQRAGG